MSRRLSADITITITEMTAVDVISLKAPRDEVVERVTAAATSVGFFQIVDHGIDESAIEQVWAQTHSFFEQPTGTKRSLLRTKDISRGYYDRELTKNKRDQKEVFDFARVAFPNLPDDHADNFAVVDGHNQWPDIQLHPELADFRATMVDYLFACERVALGLLEIFAIGMDQPSRALHPHFGADNTSFIRLNHYPTGDPLEADEAAGVTALGDMALHHHTDSGAFTLLLQDAEGGLQAGLPAQDEAPDADMVWIDVPPVPGALVVNTGDMLQVWSNDRYAAALHRVRPMSGRARFSLPYFFNPSYETDYSPLPRTPPEPANYRAINWGAFRQARADGDFADYGAEVQIADFRNG